MNLGDKIKNLSVSGAPVTWFLIRVAEYLVNILVLLPILINNLLAWKKYLCKFIFT
jgi:hypothetical protein